MVIVRININTKYLKLEKRISTDIAYVKIK